MDPLHLLTAGAVGVELGEEDLGGTCFGIAIHFAELLRFLRHLGHAPEQTPL